VKPVQDIIGSIGKKQFKKKKKNPKSGSGQYRKFTFPKKNPKTQCETGSGYYREFKFSKKIQKSGVKPVPVAIGSVNLKKFRKPV
jgi:hypothetical protein